MVDEKQVTNIMQCLKCSREEALDVIEKDRIIDGGGDPFPLTAEQIKETRKYRQAERKHTVYNFNQRQRKENPTKAEIIATVAKFLEEQGEIAVENLEITNKERQIAFSVGENKFEFTLVQKRAPKK